MRNLQKIFAILVLFLFATPEALAHARFRASGTTPARNNNAGLKTGPCGNVPKASSAALTFKSGQTIKLQWEETINHPGYFEFAILTNNDQTRQVILTVPDNQNSGAVPHLFEADLKLPNGLSCTNCTLQMIQQMTENPANPRPYFSCVDINISATQVTPTPQPDPVDPPTEEPPAPTPDCH